VQSVDVWLNVPRRPLEASGTSGEKVAMNGGLNLSVLDGWCSRVTTAPTDLRLAATSSLPTMWMRVTQNLFITRIEQDVVPLYYSRDSEGLPRKWIWMMKRLDYHAWAPV